MRNIIKKAASIFALVSLVTMGGVLVAGPASANNRVCTTVVTAKKYNFAQALVYCAPFSNYNKPARCYGDVTKIVCKG